MRHKGISSCWDTHGAAWGIPLGPSFLEELEGDAIIPTESLWQEDQPLCPGQRELGWSDQLRAAGTCKEHSTGGRQEPLGGGVMSLQERAVWMGVPLGPQLSSPDVDGLKKGDWQT